MEVIRGHVWTNNNPHPEDLFREVFERSLLGKRSTLTIQKREDNLFVNIKVTDRSHTGKATVFMMFVAFCSILTQEDIRHKISFETTLEN